MCCGSLVKVTVVVVSIISVVMIMVVNVVLRLSVRGMAVDIKYNALLHGMSITYETFLE
jgi:hypothetical protein